MQSALQLEDGNRREEIRLKMESLLRRLLRPRFHLQMAYASATMLIFDFLGCEITHVKVPNLSGIATAFVIVLAAVQALPVYWHSKGRMNLRDAALTLPWFALFIVLLPYVQDIGSRLGNGRSLQDANFAHLDEMLGVSVPGLMSVASRYGFSDFVNRTYFLLVPFVYIAFFLPALTGRVDRAEQFVTSNFLFVFLGTPIFTLFPAIGPWYGYHLTAGPGQMKCQADLLMIRQSAVYIHHFSGVVCCPSGHVMGAVLASYSLWVFRPLRIPSLLLSGIIILSTMTTDWHYFIDVVGGVVVAIIAIVTARWLSRLNHPETSL